MCSKSTLGVCIDIAERAKDDNSDLKMLMKSASIIRKEISAGTAWTFQGSFADYVVPQRLYTFIKWIIEGPHSTVHSVTRKNVFLRRSRVADTVTISGIWLEFERIPAFMHVLVTCKNEGDSIKNKRTIEWPQHFPDYKSMGIFQTPKGNTFAVQCQI